MDSKDDNGTLIGIEMALATFQPIRDLARNWEIDIAGWYVVDESIDCVDWFFVLFVSSNF